MSIDVGAPIRAGHRDVATDLLRHSDFFARFNRRTMQLTAIACEGNNIVRL